jgi:hypothetical protein
MLNSWAYDRMIKYKLKISNSKILLQSNGHYASTVALLSRCLVMPCHPRYNINNNKTQSYNSLYNSNITQNKVHTIPGLTNQQQKIMRLTFT